MGHRVAVVQYDIAWESIAENLATIERMIEDVEADPIVLMEMFQTGFVTDPRLVADDGRTLSWMCRMAKRLDAAVVGSVVVRDGEAYRNRMYFVKPTGEVEWYDKRHLFSIGGEAGRFTAGTERKVVEWRGVRYLLEICYDLRFPVWSRQRGDYDAIIYSALWPKARRDVWCTLLKARAIENQAYVIGVNRVGCEPELEYAGDSAVVDYRGRYVVDCGEMVGFSVAELNFEEQTKFRERFNVARDADSFEIM